MLAKIRTSLLTARHAELLHFQPYAENHGLLIHPQYAGFKLPYFTLDGKVDPDFYRFRFTQDHPTKGFGSLVTPEKPRRYAQPAGSSCGVYLPPLLDKTWRVIAKDPNTALVLTEGELKAACACTLGAPTIGLGGVYNWRSAKKHQELLPILDEFVWEGRPTNLCFDSDIATNPMVRAAASFLASVLSSRGAKTLWTKLLPGEHGEKQGMDDLAYAQGPQALMDALAHATPIGSGIALYELNNDVALVRSTGEVVELSTGIVYSSKMFTDTVYRNRTYVDWGASEKGVTKYTAKEWLAWDFRNEVASVDYDPACDNVVTPAGDYNSWYARQWACLPSDKGTTAPWEDLFKWVFAGMDELLQQWVRQWFAYPLQYPGAKLNSAMLVWGRRQGTGKTMLGETMAEIYGSNYGTVNTMQLDSQFTEWAVDKQFIVGDEISLGDKRQTANCLKDMITRATLRLNVKNRKSYVVKDHTNFYFTSNHEDAIYMENDDRRIFVHCVESEPLSQKQYQSYQKWLKQDGGAARLFYYLKNEVDCATFDPQARAPMTRAKAEMMTSGRGDAEDWCVQVKINPDSVLKTGFDLYRTVDLLDAYDPDHRERIKVIGIGKALGAAGVAQVANGSNNGMIEGMRTRFWAVRNVSRYRLTTAAEAAKEYQAERDNSPKKKFEAEVQKRRVQ